MRKEMSAKFFVLFLFSVLLISIAAVLVSAQATNGQIVFDSVKNFLQTAKLNPETLSSFLLGILLWIILYSIVKEVFSFSGAAATWGSAAVSLIIVILTFLYLPTNFVQAIALQYSAMGATILTVIPFVILLYFTAVVSKSKLVARGIWLFYTIYYFSMFAYKVASSTQVFSADNIPYFGAIIAGILMIVLVGFMRGVMFNAELDAETEQAMKGVKLRQAGRKVLNSETESLGVGKSSGVDTA